MSDVVNLNKVRKQKARVQAERQAAENRVRYGRNKTQKALDAAEREAAQQRLDRLRRDPPPDA